MHAVKGLDVFGHELHELLHGGFHSGGIAGGISSTQKDSIKPLVICTHPKTLTGCKLGNGGFGRATSECRFGVPEGQIHHDAFDLGDMTLQQRPLRAQPLERPATQQPKGGIATLRRVNVGKPLEAIPIRPDAVAER